MEIQTLDPKYLFLKIFVYMTATPYREYILPPIYN